MILRSNEICCENYPRTEICLRNMALYMCQKYTETACGLKRKCGSEYHTDDAESRAVRCCE